MYIFIFRLVQNIKVSRIIYTVCRPNDNYTEGTTQNHTFVHVMNELAHLSLCL